MMPQHFLTRRVALLRYSVPIKMEMEMQEKPNVSWLIAADSSIPGGFLCLVFIIGFQVEKKVSHFKAVLIVGGQ